MVVGPCIEGSLRFGVTLAPENLYFALLSIVMAIMSLCEDIFSRQTPGN